MIICAKILVTLLVLMGGTAFVGMATLDSLKTQEMLKRVLYGLIAAVGGLFLVMLWMLP